MKTKLNLSALMMVLIMVLFSSGCKKDDNNDNGGGNGNNTDVAFPTVITTNPFEITANSAQTGGTILNNGGADILSYGVCYSVQENPNIDDLLVLADTLVDGVFYCNLTDLQPNTSYYVKAFAINSAGVGYGKQKTFNTNEGGNPVGPYAPIGTVFTFEEILNLTPGFVFNEPASLYGIITADEVSGNHYRRIYIQDRLSGEALGLWLEHTSSVHIGDSVRVCLEGAMFVNYHNLFILDNINPDEQLEVLATGLPIEPLLTTITEINSGAIYPGRLIRLENVRFTEHTTFADLGYASSANRILADVNNTDNTVIVRTSNLADFAGDTLPNRACNLVAIASLYNTTWQMLLRSKDEIEEFGDPFPTPAAPGEVQSMPYMQEFRDEFGTYSTYNVEGPQSWEINYNTAWMRGNESTVNGTVYYDNEDWLISSPVAITGVSDAKMVVEYIGRYFSDINNDVSLWVSTNYIFGESPLTATWTRLQANLVQAENWNDFLTLEIALTEFVGQTITIAVKYISNVEHAGVMEVKSILVEEGTAVNPTPPGPGTVTGDGSRNNPYSANDIIILDNLVSDGNKYWVRDRIVGVVNTSTYEFDFTSATTVVSNLLLSSSVYSCYETNSIPIQLPVGDVRNGLNLADNPGNYGQEVLVYGTLEKYFNRAAVKNVTYAEINGNSYGTDPEAPPTPGNWIFYETFANGQGQFTIQDVDLPSPLDYIWAHLPSFVCMKASAYYQTSYAGESWLVSPSINLNAINSATLTFDQAVNYGTPQGFLHVMVSSNYYGDVTTATWTELEVSNWPQGTDWVFVTSTANMSAFTGHSVHIAFKYTSTVSNCANWEVKNIRIGN